MMYKFLAAGLMASTALAAGTSPAIMARDIIEIPCIETGMKDCGDGCIEPSWTCCPAGDGGCGPGFYCHSEGGCCPIGKLCEGDGGATTIPGGTLTQTNTIPVEVPTDTVPVEEPTYAYPTESSAPPASSTPTPSSSATPTYEYPTQSAPPTFTGAADRNVGSGVASFAGVIAGLLML